MIQRLAEGSRSLTKEELKVTGLGEGALVKIDPETGQISFWERRADDRWAAVTISLVKLLEAKEALRNYWLNRSG